MVNLQTTIGLAAAVCTTVSYYPQLKKCWLSGSAGDLSLTMFSILATGVALWIVYGVLQSDLVIVLSNSASLLMLAGILYCKLKHMFAARGTPAASAHDAAAQAWTATKLRRGSTARVDRR